MHVLFGMLSTAVLVHLVAMALDTGQPSVWVFILCAVVIIFAGAERGRFSFYDSEKPLGISIVSVVRLLEEGRGSHNPYSLTCSPGEGLEGFGGLFYSIGLKCH